MSDKEMNGSMGNHPMWSMHRFVVIRMLLALLIIGIVFHVGMLVGELKGEVESGRNGGGYQQWDDHMRGNMMYQNRAPYPAPTTTAPATVTPTPGLKSTTSTTTNSAK